MFTGHRKLNKYNHGAHSMLLPEARRPSGTESVPPGASKETA
jgi:hypothetical protein